jgi:hypothetical protein
LRTGTANEVRFQQHLFAVKRTIQSDTGYNPVNEFSNNRRGIGVTSLQHHRQGSALHKCSEWHLLGRTMEKEKPDPSRGIRFFQEKREKR